MSAGGVQDDGGTAPIVSIGMPVHNAAATLRQAIESMLSQTFTNFELIISDNASTDETGAMCEEYAGRDRRVRYVLQSQNIGGSLNFEFVRAQATGRYFIWAAADDVRSADFLAENVAFLEENPGYVASTSPHVMEGQDVIAANLVTFSASGRAEDRFASFFATTTIGGRRYRNCWRSHGIFYSLMRREVLKGAPPLGEYLGSDWALDLYLLSRGGIHRTTKGLTVFGAHGVSSTDAIYRLLRKRWVEWFVPFYELSVYAMSLSAAWPLRARAWLLIVLADLNFRTTYWRAMSRLARLRASERASGLGGS